MNRPSSYNFMKNIETRLFFLLIAFATLASDFPLTEVPAISGGARPGPVLWLVDVPMILIIFYWLSIRRKIILYRSSVIFIFYLFAEIFSLFNAEYIENTIFQIIQTLRGFIIFLIVTNYVNNKEKLTFTVRSLLIVAMLHITFSFVQLVNGKPFGLHYLGETAIWNTYGEYFSRKLLVDKIFGIFPVSRYLSGLLGSPYFFAAFLELILPIVISLLLFRIKLINYKYIYYIFAGGVLLIILTLNRAAWGGLIFAIVIIYHILNYLKRRKNIIVVPRKIRIIYIFMIIFILGFSLKGVIHNRIFNFDLGEMFSARMFLNEVGLQYTKKHLITGIGANNFIFKSYNDFLPTSISGYTVFKVPTVIHNLYVLTLAETGIMGISIMVFFFLNILNNGVKCVKLLNDKEIIAIIGGIMAGLMGFLMVHSLFTWIFRAETVFMTVLILSGIIIAVNKFECGKH